MGARPTLSTRDSRIVNSTFTGHDSTLCPAMWMDHIYPVVVRPGRPHVDARASEADDCASERVRSVVVEPVLSVLVRARASVARGVEERARGQIRASDARGPRARERRRVGARSKPS